MARVRRILLPTDFSRGSTRAFATALGLAKESRAALVIAHVLTPLVPAVGYGYVSPATFAALEAGVRRTAQARLARLVSRALAAKVRARGVVLEGLPHEEIVRAAKGADLIVMATHGRRGLPRFFLGSVTARVLAIAPCPVLTVRGR